MRRKIREIVRKFGFDIIRFKTEEMGLYPYKDILKFISSKKPMLFDLGANTGQTIKDFREVFKSSTIHSFEPSPMTFKILKENTAQMKNVHIWRLGVGSSTTSLSFNENTYSTMSSFLKIKNKKWGQIHNETMVEVTTIDKFCEEQNIQKIDVLKMDVQGFELEVLKGAKNSILKNKIGLLLFEVTFIDMYEGLPSFSSLYEFAVTHGFELVSFYPIHYNKKNMAVYTDVLFKHKSY